ncbi:MAG TPA: GNAT family N-acetyltransferase [Lachnospiraceae bacterium]|nr:GNAT family N-acetyltransferase [Lachnospiraceae bacterium]
METERLILRSFEEKDLDDLYDYLSNPEVVKYEPYRAMNREETKDNLNFRITCDEFIAVELKDTHKVIGNIYFGHRDFNTMELGYVFNYKYQKQGYATEACQAVIADAFARNTHRIFAECDPQNTNSWHLLEKLGFAREAHIKENVYFWTNENGKPIWKDTFMYSLLNPNR